MAGARDTDSSHVDNPSDIEIAFRELEASWRARQEAQGAIMSAEAKFQELRPWPPRELYEQKGESFFRMSDSGDPIIDDDSIERLRRLRSSGARRVVDAYDAWKAKLARISEFTGLDLADAAYGEQSGQFRREIDHICSMTPSSVRDSAIQVYCYALVSLGEDPRALRMIEGLADRAGVETNISLPWEMCGPAASINSLQAHGERASA